MDLSFATLGWLNRAAQAVGGIRFAESVQRARFYLGMATRHAVTPADVAVIAGLTASLQMLIQADRDACEILSESLSAVESALASGSSSEEV